MEKESHVQWAFYDLDHNDYYVSLEKDTLDEVKKWNIIKSKIVYFSDKNIRELVQKKLLITIKTVIYLKTPKSYLHFLLSSLMTKSYVWLSVKKLEKKPMSVLKIRLSCRHI